MSAVSNVLQAAPGGVTNLKIISEIDHEFWESSRAIGFKPPEHQVELLFTVAELAGSVARLSAHSDVDMQVVEALIASFLRKLDAFLPAHNDVFSIGKSVLGLADAARTAFSAEIGVGVCDLYMTSLGYFYRSNARRLIPRGVVGDFLYDGAPTQNAGVVLVEGKGSIGARASVRHVRAMARAGYERQVDRHVGTQPKGVPILHGYAIGVGARPGRGDSQVHVVETGTAFPSASNGPSGHTGGQPTQFVGPQVQIALENYKAVFLLMHAPRMITAIDAARAGDLVSSVSMVAEEFRVLRWRGVEYVVVAAQASPSLEATRATTYALRRDLVSALWEQLPYAALGVSRGTYSLRLPQWPAAMARNREARDGGAEFPDGFAYMPRTGPGAGDEEHWVPTRLSFDRKRLEEIVAEFTRHKQFQYA
jgi:hypothetical protein